MRKQIARPKIGRIVAVPVIATKNFLFLLLFVTLVTGCGKKKDDKKPEDSAPGESDQNSGVDALKAEPESIPAREEKTPNANSPGLRPEITVGGELYTNYYNRATASPYFQASTELKDLFPDISNPKTSQLCLPTIMSYEIYTQLTAKPSLLNSQAESHLMRPVTEQVREMYRVCETDRFRGTTAPQAANCAVKAAYATGLKPDVHVIGLDAKWKAGGYYIDSVTTDDRPVVHKDIIDAVANRYSAMFLIGFYDSTDGVTFERKGGHFISITATGVGTSQSGALKIWIVDPATPGNEKAGVLNPFNGTIKPLIKPEGSNLEATITSELTDSTIDSAGFRIFIESAIRLSLSKE